MTLVSLFGTAAAVCTTVAFIPQVLQIWRTRSAKDVSLPMYLIFTTGLVCWLCYGLLLMAWPIIAANVVTLGLALAVIGMKLKFG